MKSALAVVAMFVAVTTGPVVAQRSCDRACLNQIADAYIAALVAHDPARAPLAPNVKFTEQAQVRAIGEGLWKTALGGPTTFKIPVADPVDRVDGLYAAALFEEWLESVPALTQAMVR